MPWGPVRSGGPSGRREWVAPFVLAALILVAGLLALPDPDVVSTDRRPSSTRASPSGVLALYEALVELGVPVDRRLSPLVDGEPIPGAMAVVAPTEPLSPRERGALMARVREGGSLLLVPGARDLLLDSLGLGRVPWWEVAMEEERSLSLEIVAAAGASSGGVAAPDGVWSPRPTDHPWTAGLPETDGFARAFTAEDDWSGVPLIADDSLLFAVVVPVGRGRVVALSDALPLTNRWIRDSGVAPLMVRAAREITPPGATLVFDEFHHGFQGGSVRGAVAGFLARHPVGHLGLQLMGVLLLGLLVAGRRFGAPRRARAVRRSPLEHVDALARAYREAGAERLPRLHLLSGLARHARRPRPHDEREARALLNGLRIRAPGAAGAVDRLERGLGEGDDDLVAVAAAVDRVAAELSR